MIYWSYIGILWGFEIFSLILSAYVTILLTFFKDQNLLYAFKNMLHPQIN